VSGRKLWYQRRSDGDQDTHSWFQNPSDCLEHMWWESETQLGFQDWSVSFLVQNRRLWHVYPRVKFHQLLSKEEFNAKVMYVMCSFI
jgi:hypothetical protein